MSWSKCFALTAAILFILGIAMIDCAVAGEMIKWHGMTNTVETKQIEVGDMEGHVMLVTKSKQLYFNDAKNDERWVGDSVSTMNINPKMKQMSLTGSGWIVSPDGSKAMRTHEGKAVGEGHWKGTWKFVKGTGKYEGVKGGGTWEMLSVAEGHPSYLEILGEWEYPKQ